MSASRLLLFGASGAIGTDIGERFEQADWKVVRASRHRPSERTERWIVADPFSDPPGLAALRAETPFDAVCWAQGANWNDSVFDVDMSRHLDMYKANCGYIVATLQYVLSEDLLARPARLCVISSIWQDIVRQNKLSYTITKAALRGLVLSAATDLARHGHLINAVLPGVLDTPMTRQNLSPDQVDKFSSATFFNRLPTLRDVSNTVYFLCSPQNTGITGQFTSNDLGYSHTRIV